MTKSDILRLASRSDGLLVEFSDHVCELIGDGIVTAKPIGGCWFIIRAVPVHTPSPYTGRPKRLHWTKRACVELRA